MLTNQGQQVKARTRVMSCHAQDIHRTQPTGTCLHTQLTNGYERPCSGQSTESGMHGEGEAKGLQQVSFEHS